MMMRCQRKRPLYDKLLSRIVLEVGADGSTQLRLTAASTTSATRRAGDPATSTGKLGGTSSAAGATQAGGHSGSAPLTSPIQGVGPGRSQTLTQPSTTSTAGTGTGSSGTGRGPSGGAASGLSPVRSTRRPAEGSGSGHHRDGGPGLGSSASQSMTSPPGAFGRSTTSVTSRPGHASTVDLQRPRVRASFKFKFKLQFKAVVVELQVDFQSESSWAQADSLAAVKPFQVV